MFFRIKKLDTSFFRFVTNHAFDGRTEFSSLDRVCIPFSAVNNKQSCGHHTTSLRCNFDLWHDL